MKTMSSEPGTVNQKISRCLLSYRSSPHSTTQVSPAELFLGRLIRTRLDIIRPNLGNKIQKKTTPSESNVRSFQEGDSVWVEDYRASSEKWINGTIVHQLGPLTYKVKVGDLIWKRHIDQIRSREPSVTVPHAVNGGGLDLPLFVSLPPVHVAERHNEKSVPTVSSGNSPTPVAKTPVRDKLADSPKLTN